VHSEDALISFIFMACVIDYLSGFWWGKDTRGHVKDAYTGFVNEYFPPYTYNTEGLYDSLRNGLVHMFTIKGKKYTLTNNPKLHLVLSKDGQVVLNAANFRDDLLTATQNYFNEVENNPDLLAKLIERYGREGFLDADLLEV
jgi:hypothetical protein